MDHLEQLRHRYRNRLLFGIFASNVIIAGCWWLAANDHFDNSTIMLGITVALGLFISIYLAYSFSQQLLEPLQALWQAIVHLSPTEHGVPAPQPDQLKLGRELVTGLVSQIYQLADGSQSTAPAEADMHYNFVANNLPLPLIVLDESETIQFANESAAHYLGQSSAELVGKNVYMILDMSFPSEATFDSWLKEVKQNSATATTSWERVRLNVRDNHPTRLFDLAAYYNKDNSQHQSTMLVLFDHTKQYSQDDQAVSFMALSVHELRTPLTVLRGYIEVFEDEISPTLSPELQAFMRKMRAQSEQLTAFVNNILNVARVDDDQLVLQLKEENWGDIIKAAIESLSLRAGVRDIKLECTVAPDLPTVGVDRISIIEVINNLVDNAIKYSGDSKKIIIDAHLAKDGLIETTVQDFGKGIGSSIVPNLFTKFYRDHRNRAQIGGTGLGLYLSKAIVTAHGGNIWVRSTEGKGSTFGFSLLPYSQLTDEVKNNDNKEIVRSAHGWIKNHSLYRR